LNPRRLLIGALIFFVACAAPKQPGVEDLDKHERLSLYKLISLAGTRDGDRLDARAVFSDSSSMLTMDMHFAVGAPTRLSAGEWRWTRNGSVLNGTVAARSVDFLGGQSGPPSMGGNFDLLDAQGAAHYRVTIPLTELKARLGAPSVRRQTFIDMLEV
jgi:hypothetical protein